MKIKYKTKEQEIFGKILENYIGQNFMINDKSDESSSIFILRKKDILGISENLSKWYEEADLTPLTAEYAEEFIFETYNLL
jgi:hypothetical protein